jgi:hypothetical protein
LRVRFQVWVAVVMVQPGYMVTGRHNSREQLGRLHILINPAYVTACASAGMCSGEQKAALW